MTLDLEQYSARIEFAGAFRPTLETLRGLHLAHATHIPFENLDVLLGRPILLDLDSVFAKLVIAQRGGYCFEQNALFASVLDAAGFKTTRLAARVRIGTTQVRPRSHMLLAVEIEGAAWIADVGFGAEVFLQPSPLEEGRETEQFGWRYRIVREDALYVLQSHRREGWFDLYSFTLEPQYPVDYQVSNYYTSTFPESLFVTNLVVQRPGQHTRLSLMNRKFTEAKPGGAPQQIDLAGEGEVLEILTRRFGLELPEGTRLPTLPASSTL